MHVLIVLWMHVLFVPYIAGKFGDQNAPFANEAHAFGGFLFWQYLNKTSNLPNINLRQLYSI